MSRKNKRSLRKKRKRKTKKKEEVNGYRRQKCGTK